MITYGQIYDAIDDGKSKSVIIAFLVKNGISQEYADSILQTSRGDIADETELIKTP